KAAFLDRIGSIYARYSRRFYSGKRIVPLIPSYLKWRKWHRSYLRPVSRISLSSHTIHTMILLTDHFRLLLFLQSLLFILINHLAELLPRHLVFLLQQFHYLLLFLSFRFHVTNLLRHLLDFLIYNFRFRN